MIKNHLKENNGDYYLLYREARTNLEHPSSIQGSSIRFYCAYTDNLPVLNKRLKQYNIIVRETKLPQRKSSNVSLQAFNI